MNKLFWGMGLLALAILINCGGSGTPNGIAISNAWVRPTLTADGTTAAYMLIKNYTAQDDELLSASSNVAARIELHETMQMNGMLSMESRRTLAVPAHGQLALSPGGAHMMLLGVKQELKPGDQVPLLLYFEHAPTIAVSAQVMDEAQ